jgi:hypothetical protein
MQVDIADVVKKRKRKKNRIIIDNNNSRDNNYKTDTVLRKHFITLY